MCIQHLKPPIPAFLVKWEMWEPLWESAKSFLHGHTICLPPYRTLRQPAPNIFLCWWNISKTDVNGRPWREGQKEIQVCVWVGGVFQNICLEVKEAGAYGSISVSSTLYVFLILHNIHTCISDGVQLSAPSPHTWVWATGRCSKGTSKPKGSLLCYF